MPIRHMIRGDAPVLTGEEAGVLLGVSADRVQRIATLHDWPKLRIGHRVFYRAADILDWEAAHRQRPDFSKLA